MKIILTVMGTIIMVALIVSGLWYICLTYVGSAFH